MRKKTVSLIVVLTFLMTLFPLALPAFAASTDMVKVSGSYTYVKDKDNQTGGSITIAEDDWKDEFAGDTIYFEIEMNDGVEIKGLSVDGDKLEEKDFGKRSVTGELKELPAVITFDTIDVPKGVKGNITADITVWGVTEDNVVAWEGDWTVTIAKVASGDVAIEVDDPETLTVGSDAGAEISIRELSPGAFEKGDKIYLTIRNGDVEWRNPKVYTGVSVSGGLSGELVTDDSDEDTLVIKVDQATTTTRGRIDITPNFRVLPGADGDVEIRITGDTVDNTTVLVGRIGEGGVAIEVEDAEDEVIYRGSEATLEDVEVNLDPSGTLYDDDYITVTLPDGFEWADEDEPFVISGIDEDDYDLDVYNSDQSVWISIEGNGIDDDFDLTDFNIIADADAELGEVELTFGGDAKGTAVIAECMDAFTITCEPTNVPLRGSDVAINDIIIVEADDEALWETDGEDVDDNDLYFDIELPMGVSFAKVPKVEVEDGNLKIKSVRFGKDDSVLTFEIDKVSGIASTIEITDIELDIDNRAVTGDIVAKVGKNYNVASSRELAQVTVGRIVGEDTGNVASFTLGSTTFILNGEEQTMDVAPYAKDGRSYLPMRFVGQALGIPSSGILWHNGTATFISADRVVSVTIGSKIMYINGAAVQMDAAPEISNGRTMLPMRWLGVAFGAYVDWDGETQTVTVEK